MSKKRVSRLAMKMAGLPRQKASMSRAMHMALQHRETMPSLWYQLGPPPVPAFVYDPGPTLPILVNRALNLVHGYSRVARGDTLLCGSGLYRALQEDNGDGTPGSQGFWELYQKYFNSDDMKLTVVQSLSMPYHDGVVFLDRDDLDPEVLQKSMVHVRYVPYRDPNGKS